MTPEEKKTHTPEEPHTLPGETPGQRVEREKREAPKTKLTEVEVKAQEAEVARAELEVEKAKKAIADRDGNTTDSAAASVAHSLSLAKELPKK